MPEVDELDMVGELDMKARVEEVLNRQPPPAWRWEWSATGVWSSSTGKASQTSKTAITQDTVYRIASIT